ncbi:AAA family ATPase [Polynucleobacter sphagniphilus]|uniref:AAA family ATPase n=1 Tax=Polynucleobacter sphagniphilus TaxID=1743169 RepID=UPI002406F6EE|nr:ATP-binding protein [Polynucleobacter sphagniphilus]MDF9788118.1 hypothetical protein [Polynucleobacter sphagniphilus]
MNSTDCLKDRQQLKPVFVSGYGQFHTNEADPAKPSKRLTPYKLLSRQDIEAMVDNPTDVPKSEAPWMIASSLKSRVFADQEKNGSFGAMVNDFDNNPTTLENLASIVSSELHCNLEVYPTKSATENSQRARLIIWLAKPLTGEQYLICQELMVDLFNKHGIESDPRVLEAGQLFYLPNRGEFYKSISVRDANDFDPLEHWALEIDLKRSERIKAEQTAKAKQEEARKRREALQASSDTSSKGLIGQFNRCFAVEDILLGAGYAQHGNNFRHPHSESGSYSASVKGGRVYSLSPNDPLYTANDSNGAHDAFSAFTWIYHGGNTSDALKDAGDNWLRVGGESFNKACQRAYMQERENNGLGTLSGSLAQLKPSVDSVTGELIELENTNDPFLDLMTMEVTKEAVEKLDDAKFIYSYLLVAGHLIVICAQANGGKTTIFVYICAQLAKNGYRVLYINADASASDLKTYAEHAHDNGYTLLNPDLTNGSAEKVIASLKGMSQQLDADYSKTVLVLDTLKKFSDLMQKSKAKEFNNILRALTAKGMTIICLAHTNKYKDADGKPVFEGTGDLRNDVDELIYLIPVKNTDGSMTVSTDADKVRARVENMSFSISADGEVSALDGYVDTLSIAHEQQQYKEDESIIEFVQSQIGFASKTASELYQLAKQEDLGIAKRRLQTVLNRYADGKSKNPKWLAIKAPTHGYRYGLIANGYLSEILKKVGGG